MSLRAYRPITALALGAGLALSTFASGALAQDDLSGDLVFWSSFTQGPRAEYMQRMADKFTAAHPNVKISIETFSWNEFNTKWTTGLAAGQVPDISTALPNQVVEMIDVGALVPVDDVIDAIGRDQCVQFGRDRVLVEAAIRNVEIEPVVDFVGLFLAEIPLDP